MSLNYDVLMNKGSWKTVLPMFPQNKKEADPLASFQNREVLNFQKG